MALTHNTAIVVFARVPKPGTAKSRIAEKVGWDQADLIYQELLADTARRVQNLRYHVAFTGEGGVGALQEHFQHPVSWFPQVGANLGECLYNAFNRLFDAGYGNVIAIGCDCPYITFLDFENTARELTANRDVVIGPATDGGYWLVGARPRKTAIFHATKWGQNGLLKETKQICAQAGYTAFYLDTKNDIDTYEDYLAWKKSSPR